MVTRPFSAPFVIAVALAMLTIKVGWRQTIAAVAWTVLPILLLLTPWTLRNLGAMHAFVPISTNLGDTACLDRSMKADGGFRWAVEGCADPGLPEVARNRQNIGKAIGFVTHQIGRAHV